MARSGSLTPTFKEAVDAADHLKFREGLQAIGEGKGQIVATNPAALLGSVAMDQDCELADRHGARWDYVIGLHRSKDAVAVFVEVHPAHTSGVSEVEKKLRWLVAFLRQPNQAALASLTRELHWVATSGVHIPQHTPQYKKLRVTLRKQGLIGPVKHLRLT